MNIGFVVCPQCKGQKEIQIGRSTESNYISYTTFVFCPKCKGVGKVDWITGITGNITIDFLRDHPHIKIKNLNQIIKEKKKWLKKRNM